MERNFDRSIIMNSDEPLLKGTQSIFRLIHKIPNTEHAENLTMN